MRFLMIDAEQLLKAQQQTASGEKISSDRWNLFEVNFPARTQREHDSVCFRPSVSININ